MRVPLSERPALDVYPFVTVHPIRYGDLDPNNHVNNAAVATYLEIGRTEFFDKEGVRLTGEGRGISLVHLEIEYHREILYPGFVQIAIGIRRVGASSLTFDQAVFVGGERFVSGSSTTAQIDLKLRRSTPWNDAQRAKFETLRMK
ncbi:MAG: acyl-CoA thioesterase [Proteobacteria bacterium]|nr:acyl-CoA thioesterase [Pseudomonadota bacterium]